MVMTLKNELYSLAEQIYSNDLIWYPVMVFVLLPVCIRILCFNKKFKSAFLMRMRLAFLKHKDFFGTYADNLYAMKRFYAESAISIIPQHIQDDNIKLTFLMPEGVEDKEMAKVIMREQARQQTRRLRKEHKTTLFYVHDHFINRMFGWKHSRLTRQLEK